jgi:threonine synthase
LLYESTRGNAPILSFRDALLAGLARDGGLYLPQAWPVIEPAQIRAFATMPYADIAKAVLSPFTRGEIDAASLGAMIDDSYATFRHPAVTPLVQTGPGDWILELFHGPTLAFKDVAMQLLARLMDHVLDERKERATIVGATSGDTGGAAIEAFKGRANTDIFILFPKGRVSPVQQRQMTTAGDANVHAVAVEGNFDDCQALVKAMFNDHAFRDRVKLSGVNSINWGRIMAQIVYYFAAASRLGAPERAVSFTVPTGNFGDIFAGYAAKRMGLPIGKLIIATNRNDILARTLASGRYEVTGVSATTSPSMDIQVSSNFERLIYEAAGRDASAVSRMMAGLGQSGAFTLPREAHEKIAAEFGAGVASEEQTAQTMALMLAQAGYRADPHTAVGIHVAAQHRGPEPMVTLATAHPAKFPDAVEAATRERPALPAWCADLMGREEKFDTLPNHIGAIEAYISTKSRQK